MKCYEVKRAPPARVDAERPTPVQNKVQLAMSVVGAAPAELGNQSVGDGGRADYGLDEEGGAYGITA